MKILHNSRCSKSRSALEILEKRGVDFEIINYLTTPPTSKELKEILGKLKMPAKDIIRKGESVFKENYKGKTLTEDEWIEAMVKYPILIERPIIIDGEKAVIARPTEKIEELF